MKDKRISKDIVTTFQSACGLQLDAQQEQWLMDAIDDAISRELCAKEIECSHAIGETHREAQKALRALMSDPFIGPDISGTRA